MKVLDLLSLKTKLSTWGGLGEKSFLFLGGWGYIFLWVRPADFGNAKRELGRSDLVFLPQKFAYYFTSKCFAAEKAVEDQCLISISFFRVSYSVSNICIREDPFLVVATLLHLWSCEGSKNKRPFYLLLPTNR